MKYLLTALFIALTAVVQAQQRFEATVVDGKTHEVLPFASVYVNRDVTTITNAEGNFAISCDSEDVLRISYVGYKTTNVKAAHLQNIVVLEPEELQLQEVTVVPIGPMINKLSKETKRMKRNHSAKKGQFFYRQTAFSDSTCYEFAEAFLTGGSAVALHNLKLITGRYAGLKPDSTHAYSFFGNFYTFSELEVEANYTMPLQSQDVLPLFKNYDKFYDVSYEVTSEDGNRIFIIHFDPKPDMREKYTILGATFYVDEKKMHLRRIVGVGYNFTVVTKFKHYVDVAGVPLPRIKGNIHHTDFNYDIELSNDKGFPEVQSAFVEAVHKFQGHTVTTRSLLYNISETGEKKRSVIGKVFKFIADQYQGSEGKGQKLNFNSELHEKIEEQGYDPDFWRANEIVCRTPIEEEVQELFEQQNLFGVMSQHQ